MGRNTARTKKNISSDLIGRDRFISVFTLIAQLGQNAPVVLIARLQDVQNISLDRKTLLGITKLFRSVCSCI